MTLLYAYRGHAGFIAGVESRLDAAGYVRTADVSAADAAISFCTSQSALEDLYFGDEGLIQQAAPGSLLIDLSATTPNFAREVNAVAVVSDLLMVEAPVVVEDMACRHAFVRENLTCFAAGDDEGVERAMPLLEALFATVNKVGGPGAAQLARASCTIQATAQVIAAIEADALRHAVKRSVAGADLDVELVRPGSYAPQADLVMQAVRERRFDGGYTSEMLMSELSAAIMAADDAELILPQAEAALHLLELLAVVGGADKAPSALSLVYGEEEECARNGLDWTRAEEVYGDGQDEGDDCDHDHDHDDYDDYGYDDPYGAFSSN